MTPVIQSQKLSRSYGRTDALKGLDFTIPQNAIYALVGPNGAGKTTIIKLLMNILRPTTGSAQVLGHRSRQRSSCHRTRSNLSKRPRHHPYSYDPPINLPRHCQEHIHPEGE